LFLRELISLAPLSKNIGELFSFIKTVSDCRRKSKEKYSIIMRTVWIIYNAHLYVFLEKK